MKKMILIGLAMFLVVACAGPVAGLAVVSAEPAVEDNPEVLADCPICGQDMSQYKGPLNEAEVGGLLLALNDEYHAWAVYDQVIKDFGQVKPFLNIKNSEAKHIESLLDLFRTYDIPIPDNLWLENVPSFDSLPAACAVGVEAEIANVALYDKILASTNRADILTVYQALQQASNEQHLPAFQRCAD